MAEHEGAHRAGDITHAVGRERGDDGDSGIGGGEENLREDQRRRRRVDEEVIVFKRGADPAARGGALGLVRAGRLVIQGVSHLASSSGVLVVERLFDRHPSGGAFQPWGK
jgi:6-phosphogluconate dehydrogenase (decarboxylating)